MASPMGLPHVIAQLAEGMVSFRHTTGAHILIDHFDGLDTFDDLPRDGKCVSDYWF